MRLPASVQRPDESPVGAVLVNQRPQLCVRHGPAPLKDGGQDRPIDRLLVRLTLRRWARRAGIVPTAPLTMGLYQSALNEKAEVIPRCPVVEVECLGHLPRGDPSVLLDQLEGAYLNIL